MRHEVIRTVQQMLRACLCAMALVWATAVVAAPPQPSRVDPAEARSQRVRSRIFSVPKPFRYDEETDEVLHYSSIWSMHNSSPPGAPYAYYGNRLRQFLYMGPIETGGLYEAIETHHRLRELDPDKYRYRGTPR